jgi:hypothetical protein
MNVNWVERCREFLEIYLSHLRYSAASCMNLIDCARSPFNRAHRASLIAARTWSADGDGNAK